MSFEEEYTDMPIDTMEPGQAIEPEQAEEVPTEREQAVLSAVQQLEAFHAMKNIAEGLEQNKLDMIAAKVVEDYNTDLDSRKDWERSNTEIMELAKLNIKKKTYAGESVANIKYPIITSAAIQFAARAYPEIIKGTDVVKAKVVGKDPEGLKAARGKRVSEHMSWQLLNEMRDWEDGVDQLLFTLPVMGCAFKKTYRSFDNKNISEMVLPEFLVVHYHAASLEKASRITHIIELTHNEIVERIRSGTYLDFDVDELGLPPNEGRDDTDEDTPHRFLEQHRWYDLDDDGYQEPYIVTVHEASEKLVRMSARFARAGIIKNEKDEVVRIEPTHYFTRYIFMPAVDGGFYGMGFGTLLHSINSASNTVVNQLLDSGTINNRQSGFVGKGIQLGKGTSFQLKSGEWKSINVTGDDLRKNLFPLPTKEPSNTLFSLLGLMVDVGKELSGITDVLSGQSPGANVPAETTLALIEQGLQVYSSIHKRVHRSLYREFQKIRDLNILYVTPEEYANVVDDPQANKDMDYNSSDHDIIPVSDPNSTTNMQRIMKAKALLEMKGQGLNDEEINKRYLEALQVEDIEGLIPEEQPPDPLQELDIQIKQAQIKTQEAEQGKIAAETALLEEKIQSEKVQQEVSMMGAKFDQEKLTIEKAQTISNIKSTDKKNNMDAAKLVHEIKTGNKDTAAKGKDSKAEGKSAKTTTKGPYREQGMKSNNKAKK